MFPLSVFWRKKKKKIPEWEAIQCHLAIFNKGGPSFPRRRCCGGDVSLPFSASPAVPRLRSGWPSGGFRARGRFRCRVRGRSRPAFPPSIHQWETGDAGAPGTGAGSGSSRRGCGRRRPGDGFPPSGPRFAAPAPSRPPLAFSLRAGPLGGLRRRPGGAWLRGARLGLRHGGCPPEARAPELA